MTVDAEGILDGYSYQGGGYRNVVLVETGGTKNYLEAAQQELMMNL